MFSYLGKRYIHRGTRISCAIARKNVLQQCQAKCNHGIGGSVCVRVCVYVCVYVSVF